MAARTVNPNTHALRRDEFIDAGRRLIQTRGYEQFSIEELLAEVGASKGAFYHYFDSKDALLEAIVDRFVELALARVQTVVDDPQLSAIDKFRDYFRMISAFKTAQAEFLLQLMKVWLSDDNAIVRQKLRRQQIEQVTPHIAAIIRQGVAEGSFALADPDQMARVVLALILDTGEEAGELFLKRRRGEIDYDTIKRRFDNYEIALGRLLGVAPGQLELVDDKVFRFWFEEVFTDYPDSSNYPPDTSPRKENR